MKYWWVNQNQTYSHEVAGGYLWSPKTNANGARNQFYENMKIAMPGDIVFSFADTYIKAVGVVQGPAMSAAKPSEFGAVGSYWNVEGWMLPVEFQIVKNPPRPKDHMSLLGPHLPEKYSPLQANGNGQQGVYLAEVPPAMADTLLMLTSVTDLQFSPVSLADLNYLEDDQEIIVDATLRDTEKATLVMARRGQGAFRSRVQLFEPICRVTEVASSNLLVASHIKPWSKSENWERINGNNGLFLSPHIDKLFDSGLITFTEKGKLELSSELDKDVISKWHIDPIKYYGKFNQDQVYFLEFHNQQVFKP